MVTTVNSSNTVTFPEAKSDRARKRMVELDAFTELRLQLSTLLQTTLEVEQLINLFHHHVSQQIPFDSICYRYDSLNKSVEIGRSSAHSCHYELKTPQDNLGELVFTRNKRFAEDELQLLETLIGTLIFPIRNAILYQNAMHAALHDPLTGAGNRISLESSLAREIALSARGERPLSILAIDIDHFKSINDEYGHTAGDCVLKDVVRQFGSCCRGTDAIHRYGGEEFVVILHNTDESGAEISAERIRQSIEAMTTTFNDNSINVTISIGIAVAQPKDTITSLFDRADKALYTAKHLGRNRVQKGSQLVAETMELFS